MGCGEKSGAISMFVERKLNKKFPAALVLMCPWPGNLALKSPPQTNDPLRFSKKSVRRCKSVPLLGEQ